MFVYVYLHFTIILVLLSLCSLT